MHARASSEWSNHGPVRPHVLEMAVDPCEMELLHAEL